MQNKKTIMAFAGLQILFFHLWIDLFPAYGVESFLKQTSYIGVDMFFFISAYSLSERTNRSNKQDEYLSFIGDRFFRVYLKYILFAVLGFFMSSLSIMKLIKTITCIELFRRGGGSFLWFLPAIFIVYLVSPLLSRVNQKITSKGLPDFTGYLIILFIWFAVGFGIDKLTNYNAIFILWNRMPVMLLGSFLGHRASVKSLSVNYINGVTLIILGSYLLYLCGYKYRLNIPFHDFFYVIGIPATIGFILILSKIKSGKIISLIGSSTLEMYGFQMTIGYKLANWIYKQSQNALITNIVTFLCIIVLSVIVAQLYSIIFKRLKSALKCTL